MDPRKAICEATDVGVWNVKICIVSAGGGHLTEIRVLRSVYESYEYFYVLNYRVKLSHDMIGRTYFITHAERNWKVLVNFWEAWQILKRERPSLILSSGSSPIVNFAIVGKLMGIPTIYIENMARVFSPSLSGRIMYHLADRFFYQWRPLSGFFPNGVYGGPLL